jgi:hypothetical protein
MGAEWARHAMSGSAFRVLACNFKVVDKFANCIVIFLSLSVCPSVRLSFLMEKFRPHNTDFHVILLRALLQSVKKTEGGLKSAKIPGT